ncbi:MAG: NUDIX hydrolase [Gemmatimonadetes bacterium]|nr:NUDIX hydrolase [Gemmatimonadota bacterium]
MSGSSERPENRGGLERWERTGDDGVEDFGIFRVRRFRARSPRTGQDRPFTRVETGDWVNVVATTPDDEVVLVRQFRHGVEEFTLEIPGGIVDAGEPPARAAARELREETGYAGDEPELLGVVDPNPAILDNRCYTYRIRNARPVTTLSLDPGEDIEVVTMPRAQIRAAVADGRIRHALVVVAFWWDEGSRDVPPGR